MKEQDNNMEKRDTNKAICKAITLCTFFVILIIVIFITDFVNNFFGTDKKELQKKVYDLEAQIGGIEEEIESKDLKISNLEKQYQEKIKSKNSKISSLKKQLKGPYKSNVTDNYLDNVLFWKSDNTYVILDKNFKFYSDISCLEETEITENLTFVNYFDYPVIREEDGVKVFISKSKEKGYVWSTSRPYFDKLEN